MQQTANNAPTTTPDKNTHIRITSVILEKAVFLKYSIPYFNFHVSSQTASKIPEPYVQIFA